MSLFKTFRKASDPVIRNVRADDATHLARIYNEFVEHSTATFETEPVSADDMLWRIDTYAGKFPFEVVEIDGRVEGYCYAHPWKQLEAYAPTLEVTVYLSEVARGQGLGKEMVRRTIDDSRRRGFHSLIACITADNEASLALFRKLGFSKVSYFQEVGFKFGRWLDVEDLQLILD